MKCLKIGIALIMILFYNVSFSQVALELDDNTYIEEVIKFGDKILIKTSRYYYKAGRDLIYYLEFTGTKVIPFTVNNESEIIQITNQNGSYYALTRTDSICKLYKLQNIQKQHWKRLHEITLYNHEEDLGLKMKDDKIIILTEEKIYHNLNNPTSLDTVNFSNITTERYTFSYDSPVEIFENEFFIGNSRGEFGGNLLHFIFDKEKKQLQCELMLRSNIHKITVLKEKVYFLETYRHMYYLGNDIYVSENKKVKTIFSQQGYEDGKIKCKVDKYGWKKTVNKMPVLSLHAHNNELYMLISGKGVFELDEKNKLIKKVATRQSKEILIEGSEPYIIDDEIMDFFIIDNQVYLVHSTPVIEVKELKE